MNLTPPTPPDRPLYDPYDSDSGWDEYLAAKEEYEAAVVCERVLATAVQMAIRQDRADLALALLDSQIVALRPDREEPSRVTVEI